MKDLDKLEFFPEGGRSLYYFYIYCINSNFKESGLKWSLNNDLLTLCEDNQASFFSLAPDKRFYFRTLEEFNNDEKLTEVENHITSTREKAVNILQDESSYGSSSFLKEVFTAVRNMVFTASLLRNLDQGVRFRLNTHNLSALIVCEEASFQLKEKITLMKAAVNGYDKEKLEEIHSNFCWITCGYYDEEARSVEDYRRMIEEFQNPEKQLRELNDKLSREIKARNSLREKLAHEDKRIAEIGSRATYLKDMYKFSMSKVIYHIQKLFEYLSEKTDYSLDTVKNMTPGEIIKSLDGKVDEDYVKDRAKKSVTYTDGQCHEVFTGKQAEEIKSKYFDTYEKVEEWEGRTACPGKSEGSAKIVNGRKDFGKVRKEDILVVQNTNPDYMGVIRKASAIVAEDGGITAHVSVVSRELEIPCVVGITGITRQVNDGDKIFVDAEKGVVKKIDT